MARVARRGQDRETETRRTGVNAGALKTATRLRVRALTEAMDAAARQAASLEICRRLRERIPPDARTFLFYAPLAGEVDLWPLIRETLATGRRAAFPRFDAQADRYRAALVQSLARDLIPGKFGVREPRADCPAPDSGVDWILVPGVAFDLAGNRLGRGRGFYDRLLSELPGFRCGVAFDEQIVSELPAEPHDSRLDLVVTPTRWIEGTRR